MSISTFLFLALITLLAFPIYGLTFLGLAVGSVAFAVLVELLAIGTYATVPFHSRAGRGAKASRRSATRRGKLSDVQWMPAQPKPSLTLGRGQAQATASGPQMAEDSTPPPTRQDERAGEGTRSSRDS